MIEEQDTQVRMFCLDKAVAAQYDRSEMTVQVAQEYYDFITNKAGETKQAIRHESGGGVY